MSDTPEESGLHSLSPSHQNAQKIRLYSLVLGHYSQTRVENSFFLGV